MLGAGGWGGILVSLFCGKRALDLLIVFIVFHYLIRLHHTSVKKRVSCIASEYGHLE